MWSPELTLSTIDYKNRDDGILQSVSDYQKDGILQYLMGKEENNLSVTFTSD